MSCSARTYMVLPDDAKMQLGLPAVRPQAHERKEEVFGPPCVWQGRGQEWDGMTWQGLAWHGRVWDW